MTNKLRREVVANTKNKLLLEHKEELQNKMDEMGIPDTCKHWIFNMCSESYKDALNDLGQVWVNKEKN